jgi:hypothetical protein
MKSSPNYRKQNACCNCKHIFIKFDYDEGTSYFCTYNALPRPLCGSTQLNEDFIKGKNSVERCNLFEKWEHWAKNQKVEPENICDIYEKL